MIFMRYKHLLLTLLSFVCLQAWGDTYSYTFTSTTFNSSPETKELNGVSWTLTNDGNYYGYDGTKGQQIGAGSTEKRASYATLTTSGISNIITSVKVNVSGAASIVGTVGISIGGTAFKCNGETSIALTSTATEYTFTGNASGQIVITLSQTSSKALYIKSIEVKHFQTVNNIAAFNALTDDTEAILNLGVANNARITYTNGDEAFMRDNTGAICLYQIPPTRPFAYNQHLAGWIIGKKTTDNGLPMLIATPNDDTNTDNLVIADRVSEAMVTPKSIAAEDYDDNLADWVKVSDLIVGTSDISAYNKFSLSDYYQTPHTGARIDLSGIAVPYNTTKQIAPIYQNSIRPLVYVIDEGTTFVSPASDIPNATVRLVRSLSKDYWNTFTIPFNLNIAEARIREYSGLSGTTMLFDAAENIEAGKPYLITPAEDIVNPTFTDVTLKATAAQTITNGSYSFVGIYSPYDLELDQTELFLGDEDLLYYPANASVRGMKGLRAFYRVPAGASAKVDISEVDPIEEDEDSYEDVTLIDGIPVATPHFSSGIYDLYGRRVADSAAALSTLPKGIYVVGGKKLIVK